MFILVLISAVAWLGVLFVPWRPWSTRERIEPADSEGTTEPTPELAGALSTVTVLVPARDEAGVIGRTLKGLREQGSGVKVVVIDDQSSDRTEEVARTAFGAGGLEVIRGMPLCEGWSGKLWALEQGWQRVTTARVLLLDADIELMPGILPALLRKMDGEGLDLVSVMAQLRMASFWEKLLVPAFVYFFKLLYPFRLANDARSRVAAAAGGCILLRAEKLCEIGGFDSIRGALIDDCTLARRIKAHGGRIWLGLSHSVRSHREYPDLAGLWNMVARNAFTQLRYSVGLLILTAAALLILFGAPVAGMVSHDSTVRAPAMIALAAMAAAYLPTLRYYSRSLAWVVALPPIGALYLMMTVSSAWRYWRGRRSEWKGRTYARG